MSAFLDRLERELVDAARRDAPRPTATPSKRATLVLVAMAAVVMAALLAAAINHRSASGFAHGPASTHGSIPVLGGATAPGGASAAVTPRVALVNCDFALQRPRRELPRLVVSTQSPGAAVVDHVRVLRRPQAVSDRFDPADLDRDGLGVVEIYGRYTRLLRGPLGENIELVPALICPHSRRHPLLALLAVTVGRPRVTLLWETAAQLAGGGRTVSFQSDAEQVSATILADGGTRIAIAPGAAGARGASSTREV